MARILDEIGIYGYKLDEENRILAGLLTGDPQLFIGRHGSAKTMLAEELACALFYDRDKVPFVPYDASKVSFEDVLGFPNPAALQQGKMKFVDSPVTVWDKEFVFLDELNRAEPDMQSKLLDLVRSRKIMGYPTKAMFVWAAMNPKGYEGTNDLDEALVGRFANFVYVPDVLDLSDGLRAKVAARVGRDDSPALKHWLNGSAPTEESKVRTDIDYTKVGALMEKILRVAAQQYQVLAKDSRVKEYDRLAMWVSYFSNTLRNQTKPQAEGDPAAIMLDGRRLGLIRRQIMAVRAVQIARANLLHEDLPPLKYAAEVAVKGAIPTGVNSEGGHNTIATTAIDKAFRTLEAEFDAEKDERMFKLIVRLQTSNNLVERVRILLKEPLDDMIKNSAWTDICGQENGLDMSVLSLLAQMIEAKHPNTVPRNVLSQLAAHVDDAVLHPEISPLQDMHVEHADALTEIVGRYEGEENTAQRLMAIAKVNAFIRDTTEAENMESISSDAVKRLSGEVRVAGDELTDLLRIGVAA